MLSSPHQTINDGDGDSLFGSPPPSPSRGRSPSPLALPSGTAQNVGTLALPGSHLVAELPVTPSAFLPLSASLPAPSRLPSSQPRNAPPGSRSRTPFRSVHPNTAVTRAKKGKARERSKTHTSTPPPNIPFPPPDETPPPNFLRNQHALLGLAGMVGGINPANLSKSPQVRGTTAENPIVVEEESEPSQPHIGKQPTRVGLPDPSSLPSSSSEQILATLLKHKNVLPVLVSLLRLLLPKTSPQVSSNHFNRPSPQPSSAAQTCDEISEQRMWEGGSASGLSAPPLKRRRLTKVPAGASDWDVPYPFQEGQGPQGYRASWERERSKQLLADLTQLMRTVALKASAKAWYQNHPHLRPHVARGVVVGYGPEPTVNKYYRPKTMYYGLERGPTAQRRLAHPLSQPSFGPGLTSGSNTPTNSGESSLHGLYTLQPHPDMPIQDQETTSSEPSTDAISQLVESLLVVQQRQEQPVGVRAPDDGTDGGSSMANATFTPEESVYCQGLFDHWLQMLAESPPGDPNDASSVTPAPAPAATSSSVVPDPSTSTAMAGGIPDCLIDPALLGEAVTGSGPQASAALHCAASGSVSISNQPSKTPSLVGSPSVTVSSLADADAGPTTPSWNWAIPNVMSGDDAQALEQWAGMDLDVDVDALLNGVALFDSQLQLGQGQGQKEGESSTDATMGVDEDGPSEDLAEPGSLNTNTNTNTAQFQSIAKQPAQTETETVPTLEDHDVSSSGPGPGPGHGPTPSSGGDAHASRPDEVPSTSPAFAPAQDAVGVLSLSPASIPPPPAYTPAAAPVPSARAKGKAKAIQVHVQTSAGTGGKQDRKALLERARTMRAALAAEIDRAKVALWETTLEQGVLVGLGRELEKDRARS